MLKISQVDGKLDRGRSTDLARWPAAWCAAPLRNAIRSGKALRKRPAGKRRSSVTWRQISSARNGGWLRGTYRRRRAGQTSLENQEPSDHQRGRDRKRHGEPD